MSFDRKAYNVTYMPVYRARMRREGRCVECGAPATGARCAKHAAVDRARCLRRRRAQRATLVCAYPPCTNPVGPRRKAYCSQACATAWDPLRNRAKVCLLCHRPVPGRKRYCTPAHAQYARRLA